jgi:hypothetical protein
VIEQPISYCGLCKIKVESSELWEEHTRTEKHRIKEDEFFDSPEDAIDIIMRDHQLGSKIHAIDTLVILRNIYEMKKVTGTKIGGNF